MPWEHQQPRFDLVGWVLEISELEPENRVLDVGCGNGTYLAELRRRQIDAVGCDLSLGMLEAVDGHPHLTNADVTHLPFADDSFDVVLAPHMLYHVDDRARAAQEMRRVLRPGGRSVVVTNGGGHRESLRSIVEAAVAVATPGWEMRDPSTHVFSLDNGEAVLDGSFADVSCVRPASAATVILSDAEIAADYVASIADHYAAETTKPWSEVVADVRHAVQDEIDRSGAFTTTADCGAFVCR